MRPCISPVIRERTTDHPTEQLQQGESDFRAVGNLEVRDDQPRDAVFDLDLDDECEIRGA